MASILWPQFYVTGWLRTVQILIQKLPPQSHLRLFRRYKVNFACVISMTITLFPTRALVRFPKPIITVTQYFSLRLNQPLKFLIQKCDDTRSLVMYAIFEHKFQFSISLRRVHLWLLA